MIRENFSKMKTHVPDHALGSWDYITAIPQFWESPASSDKHHNHDGGLAQHTFEVMEIALNMSQTIPLDKGVLIVSCLWHDFGKVWAYEKNVPTLMGVLNTAPTFPWRDTEHKKKTGGHIAKSYAEWISFNKNSKSPELFVNEVGHCILSHHSIREWGSPAAPQTREAWILHLADSASARLLGGEDLKRKS